MFESKTVN